jgi:sucrose-6-phosphate hydrolase SacC (GH32 family)
MTRWLLRLGALVAMTGGASAWAASGGPDVITDKTLVAWVSPANLTQKGGSVLTLDDRESHFDGIVFGEVAPGRWMAGSDTLRRTMKDQSACAPEEAGPSVRVQVAIVYRGKTVTVYRDGRPYASHDIAEPQTFGPDSAALIGLRHLDAGDRACFVGAIYDARIYAVALSPEQLAALEPHRPSEPRPFAWWSFADGQATDRMGTFPASLLHGDARVADGALRLGPGVSYLLASKAGPHGEVGVTEAERNRAFRERLLGDPHRPGYHFVIPEGQAMPFDPNGAIYWKGRYHLFYIFQDKRGHNWGHVSSTDLFHWRHHPTGLVDGMFSGNCFLNKDGRPTMCYHQVGQGNAMAVAVDDDLNEWRKLDTNPITPPTKPGDPHHDMYRSWDPYGWVEDGATYAIFGGERPGVAKAPDLGGPWKYVGDLMAGAVPGVSINEDVSCADFFRIGSKRMLLCISHRLGARYYLGDWRNEQFHPTFHEKMSWTDNSFFAPESLLDDRGRRIMWAWIFDAPEFKMRGNFGWSGALSLPRVLTLPDDGVLRMDPPVEIERLRYNPVKLAPRTVAAGEAVPLPGIRGNSIEIEVEMDAPAAGRCGIKVCSSPDGSEETVIAYDAVRKRLEVDTSRSSAGEAPRTIESAPFALKPGERLKLRVFVDKSVVEVFANSRQAVMRRIYPSRTDSVGVSAFAERGAATVRSARAWDLMPSNPY